MVAFSLTHFCGSSAQPSLLQAERGECEADALCTRVGDSYLSVEEACTIKHSLLLRR